MVRCTTVTKWRGRTTTADSPMGPTAPHSTVLSPDEEAMVVEFRRRTLLPLDDVLGCLRDTISTMNECSIDPPSRCYVIRDRASVPCRSHKARKSHS